MQYYIIINNNEFPSSSSLHISFASYPFLNFLPFYLFLELIFFLLSALLLASVAVGSRGDEASTSLGCGKLLRWLEGAPLRGTSDQLHGGTYGLNTEPWIQPASEWVAVGKAKVLARLSDWSRWGCRALRSERCFVLYSSVYNCWLRHRESEQPGCHRPFAFLSWFWKAAYSLDWEVTDFIPKVRLFPKQVTLPCWTLLQHSLYQLFHCILNELYHKSK